MDKQGECPKWALDINPKKVEFCYRKNSTLL
jgi:hypothetical protein